MLTGLEHSELLAENLSTTAACPPDAVLQELSHLAMAHDTLPYLTAELFERLRKISGQSLASEYLGGMQHLAAQGNPAGARLLAAFLNVSTPGERLLPVVRPLNSSRRYMARLSDPDVGLGPFQTDWLKRQARAETAAAHLGQVWGLKMPPAGTKGPDHQHPWPLMRQVFTKLLWLEHGRKLAYQPGVRHLVDSLFYRRRRKRNLVADVLYRCPRVLLQNTAPSANSIHLKFYSTKQQEKG